MEKLNRLTESIFYLNEVYGVPYSVLAYVFNLSKISIYRIKKKVKGNKEEVLKKIKEKILYYDSFNKEEFKEYEKALENSY
ncbi:MAG: hypothetical protein ABIN20_00345 [candidate division WOR-3 bacterium]